MSETPKDYTGPERRASSRDLQEIRDGMRSLSEKVDALTPKPWSETKRRVATSLISLASIALVSFVAWISSSALSYGRDRAAFAQAAEVVRALNDRVVAIEANHFTDQDYAQESAKFWAAIATQTTKIELNRQALENRKEQLDRIELLVKSLAK